jgi:ABC-2 type transport system permease protein
VKLFRHQLRAEQLLFWRSREAAIFIFAFPPILFLLLGSVYTGHIVVVGLKVPAAQALLGGMTGYGAANTAFAGIAITLVIRREEGILKRLRATPLPSSVLLSAILVSTLIVFALQTVTLFVLGRLVYGTPFPDRILSMAAAVVLSAACFAALGVATASLIRSSEGSSAAVNLILLPMAFLSGSFGPTRHLPQALQAIGDVLPLKYAIRLVDVVYLRGEAVWTQPTAIAMLAGWGAAGAVVAIRKFRWEPRDR